MTVSPPPLVDRYARAAAQLPARSLPRIAGNHAAGYWIDDTRFVFAADRIDPASGRVIVLPALADTRTGEVRVLIEAEALAAALGVEPRALALAHYDLPAERRLAVSLESTTRILDLDAGTVVETHEEAQPELHAPDGARAVFVRGFDLWLRDRRTGEERPLTTDGERLHPYGQLAENDTSPTAYRRRPFPLATWSADSQWLLTHRIDERGLPGTAIVQHAPPGGGRPQVHAFQLSIVGDPLPRLTHVAIHVASGRRVEAATVELQAFTPLANHAAWFIAPTRVAHARTDRFAHTAEVVEWDLETGRERVLVRETVQTGYVQMHPLFGGQPNVRVLAETNEVVWWSERDGWGHLYLYDAGADAPKARITQGDWQVRDIVHLDAARRSILFTAGGLDPDADPALRKLCAANLDGSGFAVLAEHDGDVVVGQQPTGPWGADRAWRPAGAVPGASRDGRRVALKRTSLTGGTRNSLLDLDTGRETELSRAEPAGPAPRPFTSVAADGETRIHGALFLPSDFDPGRRYPLLDLIYPGPQMAWLPRGYGTRLAAQARALAELGMAVMMTDTRNMPLRSRAIHQAGHGHQWEPQLADNAAAALQLCERHPFLDRDRIGLMGLSGGGAATALGMFTYPEVFTTGVSICGNHDSRNYRSVWMDIYVGPFDAADGDAHSNASQAHRLEGALMLVHGDMDDNVPLAQTLELAAALIAADKDFELLVLPNAGHVLLLSHAYAQRRIWDFLARTLLHEAPPEGFHLAYAPEDLAAFAMATARELGG